MAKEKEKKVSGELNAEELENVAGGMCFTGGASAPKEVESIERKDYTDGTYDIFVTYSNGEQARVSCGLDGKVYRCNVEKRNPGNI